MFHNTLKTITSIRSLFLAIFLLTVILLVEAIFLQVNYNVTPCPLCLLQRIVFILIGLTAFFAFFHHPRRSGFLYYNFGLLFFTLVGTGISGWQVYLQHATSLGTASCGANWLDLLQNLPLNESLKLIFTHSGECPTISLRIFKLSIAEWSLGCFIFLIFIEVIQWIRIRQQ